MKATQNIKKKLNFSGKKRKYLFKNIVYRNVWVTKYVLYRDEAKGVWL